MNLTEDDKAWIRQVVYDQTRKNFGSFFNQMAESWARDQMNNVPKARHVRCSLGQAWTAGIETVLKDRETLTLILDGLCALEPQPDAEVRYDPTDASPVDRSYRIALHSITGMRRFIMDLQAELQQTRSETMRDVVEP